MRVGQVRIDIESALVLRDCAIELASLIEKCAIGIKESRRLWTETDRALVCRASFIRAAETFEKISVTGLNLAGMRIELDCAVVIFFCFIQFRFAHVEHGKINVHFRVIGIELQSSVVFLLSLVEPAVLLERGAVIKLRPCAGWQIRSYPIGALR